MVSQPTRTAPGRKDLLSEVIGRPVSVVIGALGFVVLGVFSLWRLPVSLLPTLERPRLEIVARDAERSRDELEAQAVFPLERRLLTLDGVLDVVTSLDDGEATLVLDTEWQTDVDRLRIDVERRLVGPATAGLELSVDVDAGDDRPILLVAVLGPTACRRTSFADKVLLPELGRLTGAGRLRLVGGADLRPVVEPRAADLAAHGLVAADLVARLQSVGRDRPLGRLRQGGSLRPLLVRQSIEDLAALRALPINARDLRLADVADVTLDEVPRGGVARVNGQPAVLVELFRAPGANAVRLAREARVAVGRLARRSAPLQVAVIGDSSREVVDSLLQLAQAGVLGLVLGTLVLRFLLGSWRPTCALVVVVPVSVVSAFSAFLFAGVSLDLVSLAGLALAAGMLVDNSIVVLEAISSARERAEDDAVVAGSRQIQVALVASFLTTAVVFLPLIYLRGLARAFFGVQAFAIVSTLAISLLLSLSLTPVLARRFAVGREKGKAGRQPGRGLYLRLLDHGLRRPVPWLVVAALLIAAVAALVPQLPRELVPRGAGRILIADVRLPVGLGAGATADRLGHLEAALVPILTTAGEAGGAAGEPPVAWSIIQRADTSGMLDRGSRDVVPDLEPVARVRMVFSSPADLDRALGSVRQAVSGVPGLEVRLRRQPSAVSAAIERAASDLEVEVSASTRQRLADARRRLVDLLETGGFEVEAARLDARERPADGNPARWLRWDPVRLAKLDLEADALADQLRSGLEALRVGRVSIEGAEPDIHFAPRPVDLARLPVRADYLDGAGRPASRVLPLAALAEIEARRQPPPRERRNGRPTAKLRVRGGAGDAARLEAVLATWPGEADVEVRLAGQTRELRRSFSQLRLALTLALVLVFLTVAALYESLTLPLVVMVTVPTASAGAFLALAITGQSVNVMSLLGLILLAGIVVNNAIVLLHRAEQYRTGGVAAREAVRLAASERYRPILMTTVTTLLGMIPLALLGGEGLELRRALAVSISGGLVTSWVAALLVVPMLYQMAVGGAGSPRADG